MTAKTTLDALSPMLISGEVEVVGLTQPLGPDTPIIKLPPDFAVDTPQVEIHRISEYDQAGPLWAWKWLKLGERSGTHFDPIHWITGREHADRSTDTMPPLAFVAPVNVIDCSAEVAANPDFLLTADYIRRWDGEHGPINSGEWVVMRSDWHKRGGSEPSS